MVDKSGKNTLYLVITAILLACMFLVVLSSLGLSAKQESIEISSQPPVIFNTEDDDNDIFSPTPSATDATLITQEEALQIATPLIDQYVTENNRTITEVMVEFYQNSTDACPTWDIHWNFKSLNMSVPTQADNLQYYIIGYFVRINALNGEVLYANEQGKM